jgi:hypothetical protein
MSHADIGIGGATTDSFILFENGARRNPSANPPVPAHPGSPLLGCRPRDGHILWSGAKIEYLNMR